MTESTLEIDSFDFAKHRSDAIDAYRACRGLYEAFANVVRDLLRSSIPPDCQIQSIEARAKELESFGAKAALRHDEVPSLPKYPRPLSDITDLAGVRVIVYFPKTLAGVDACISSEFEVVEKTDKAEELEAAGKFGYRSIHYLVRLKGNRSTLSEYKRFDGLLAEVQLRTILQHAWAEMEHDINYKSVASIPLSTRRRFMQLAGMLEIADREFQAIQDEDEQVRAQVRSTVDEDLADNFELTQLVNDLQSQIDELRSSRPATSMYLPGSARALLEKGFYSEAVRAYDRIIAQHPAVHTNFIGRARARFLTQDMEGALSDLETAESLYPFDPSIDRLRQQILDGRLQSASAPSPAVREVIEGNQLLSEGDGVGALAQYESASTRGWFGFYSSFNCAMALFLANDVDAAKDRINQLEPDEGTFMEVNVCTLRCLCAVRIGDPSQYLIQHLRSLPGLKRFDFSKSPLRYLESGIRRSVEESDPCLEPFLDIFGIIQRGTP